MVAEIERIAEVNTLVSIRLVIESQCRQDSQLDSRGIAVFLDGTDDLDSASGFFPPVICFDNFPESALAKQFYDIVC